MKLGNWCLVFLGLSLLGSTAVPCYLPEALRPDLFVVMTVFLAVRAPTSEALPLCWFTGLGKDLLSGGPLGGYALLYLTVGLAMLWVRSSPGARSALAYAVLGCLAYLVTESVYLGVASAHAGVWPAGRALRALLTASLVTAGLTPVCVWGLDRLGGWLGTRKRYRFGSAY